MSSIIADFEGQLHKLMEATTRSHRALREEFLPKEDKLEEDSRKSRRSIPGKKSHLKSAHSREDEGATEWFSCDQCEFRTRTKGHLRRHSLRHSGQKPHQCPHCDFHCSTIDNLRKHIVKTGKHPGKFIYECVKCSDQAPNEIFKSNTFKEYQKHLATHKVD